jgi:membrane-bound lytic murein transglycosylase D
VAAARVDARQPGAVRAVHVVRSGETLSGIAKRYKVGVSTLARLNGIRTTSILRVGQRLKLHSDSAGGSSTAGSGQVTVSNDGGQMTYVVRRGDTLSAIARALNVSVSSLQSWNNLSGSAIKPGQRLVAYKAQGS